MVAHPNPCLAPPPPPPPRPRQPRCSHLHIQPKEAARWNRGNRTSASFGLLPAVLSQALSPAGRSCTAALPDDALWTCRGLPKIYALGSPDVSAVDPSLSGTKGPVTGWWPVASLGQSVWGMFSITCRYQDETPRIIKNLSSNSMFLCRPRICGV